MALLIGRFIDKDSNTLTTSGTSLTVKLDPSGALESTAAGINIKTDGVTNSMLAGNIADAKLAEQYIFADGTRAFTGDQSIGNNKLTNLAPGTAATDAVNLSQLNSIIQNTWWKHMFTAGF